MFTNRDFVPELMDAPDVPRAELAAGLRFIRAVNRRLGGTRAALRWIERWTSDWPRERPIRIIDVGTGSADIPLAIVRWAAARGRDVRIVAVDNHATTLELAREHIGVEPRIELIDADARGLLQRFEPGSFDFAHAGMFLHHLPDIEIVTVLRIMQRLSRVGVVWNDLARDVTSRIGIRLLTIGTPWFVRHDAVVSVAKGFTRGEALDLARRAGLPRPAYRRHLFGRFTLVARST